MMALIKGGKTGPKGAGQKTAQVREPTTLFKQPDGFDPSRDLEDGRLSDGWYVIQGHLTKQVDPERDRGTAQTEGGIWVVAKEEELIPSMAKVVATAETGCEKAKVGEYVSIPAYGGNQHDDKKPYPIVRFRGDDAGLFLIHEDNIHYVLPHRKEEKKKKGKKR